ncbi:hypothetical protein TNCT_224471, partial [Trichonephila clavata]
MILPILLRIPRQVLCSRRHDARPSPLRRMPCVVIPRGHHTGSCFGSEVSGREKPAARHAQGKGHRVRFRGQGGSTLLACKKRWQSQATGNSKN